SRNSAVNRVFRRVHAFLDARNITIRTRYVPSADNPADAPSRGEYGPTSLLLLPVAAPDEVAVFLDEFDSSWKSNERPLTKEVTDSERARRIKFNTDFERSGDALLHDEVFWWDHIPGAGGT